jgi:hypothetical protein
LDQKVSISHGDNISIVGFNNVDVPNGVLEDVFHVEGMPNNFIFICQDYKKRYKFEAWLNRYVLKYINNGFKIVSSGLVDHDVSFIILLVSPHPINNLFVLMLHMLLNKLSYGMKYLSL